MTEETCDVCGSEMDDWGCLGVWTGVHTSAVFKLHEDAMTAALDSLEALERYCPPHLRVQAGAACESLKECLGKGREEDEAVIAIQSADDEYDSMQ